MRDEEREGAVESVERPTLGVVVVQDTEVFQYVFSHSLVHLCDINWLLFRSEKKSASWF